MNENVETPKPNLKDRVKGKYTQLKEKVVIKTITNHVEKNKTVYYISSLVLVAGVTRVLTRGRYSPSWTYSPKSIQMLNKIKPIGIFSKQEIHANLVKVTVNDTGRPGYLTRNIEFDRHFPTQTRTAKEFGISNSTLSRHLSGKIPDAKGLHFERFAGSV